MRLLFIIAMLGCAATVFALEDTEATRNQEAERFLKANSPGEIVRETANDLAMTLPQEKRAEFKTLFAQNVDMAALTKAVKDALIRNFTAGELKALADLYGAPEGKSAMKKMYGFLKDLEYAAEKELKKAEGLAFKALTEKDSRRQDSGK